MSVPIEVGEPEVEGSVREALGDWRGSAIVVAVSGGGDSVGLLRAVASVAGTLDLRPTVAHLDHGVRGEASAADARFVSDLADSLGLPIDLGTWRPRRTSHFEADARRARYDWLIGVARDRGARAVAVGHNRDDQAETILQRILRGTGPRGLAGIPARRRLAEGLTLVRPLLATGRGAIREYLRLIGQSWREDASNADCDRTRARLRHDLLPKLADEYNPRVAEALVRLGGLAEAEHRALQLLAERFNSRHAVRDEARGIGLPLDRLRRRPPALRAEIARAAWRSAGFPEGGMDARRWVRLARLIEPGGPGRLSVGSGVEAIVQDGRLWLGRPGLRLTDPTAGPTIRATAPPPSVQVASSPENPPPINPR